jgi:hypothetical protein
MNAADAARRWASVWQQAWEAEDVDSIVALYAPSARHWSSPFREPAIGPAGVRAYVSEAFDEESDVRAWFGSPVVAGDQAAVAWWATLIENADEITLAGTSLLRFDDDGLVVSQWDAWNQADGRREPPAGWGSGDVSG